MLFTAPPVYTTNTENRQRVGTQDRPGQQSVLQGNIPSFPGSTSATGSVGQPYPPQLSNFASSSYHVPSSYLPQTQTPTPLSQGNPGPDSNLHNMIKALVR